MTTIINEAKINELKPGVEFHPAWHGKITRIEVEDRLNKQAPYTYLLRKGKFSLHYYVSFVFPNLNIKHEPFIIIITPNGWYSRNGTGSGPFINQSIGDIIHLIMHCKPEDCRPLIS